MVYAEYLLSLMESGTLVRARQGVPARAGGQALALGTDPLPRVAAFLLPGEEDALRALLVGASWHRGSQFTAPSRRPLRWPPTGVHPYLLTVTHLSQGYNRMPGSMSPPSDCPLT